MTHQPAIEDLDRFVYSQTPGYVERDVRKAFHNAVPLKTVVTYCYDPRAADIPVQLAKLLADEVYPGEVVHDGQGNKVGSTSTIFPVVVAGGRAIDALRSITIAHHLFGLEKVVVVHHTNCGTSSFTSQGLLEAYQLEQGIDIGDVYDKESIAIDHLTSTLRHDVQIVRDSPAVPASVEVIGYVYDIDADAFVGDIAITPAEK
ncbi:carbonic anhydrase [Mycobacterium sp. E2462]|uniref:carbonic anhydrase n=1 Tax=Mycobacterium sp. E2462 TaxID=1834133 RepID=UPI0007FCEB01|nr:carbonic anhydrase [Mycobacterium sp. E2462]OBI22171.1 carbonic anhydrase [Mycobacterium sp. E2462]